MNKLSTSIKLELQQCYSCGAAKMSDERSEVERQASQKNIVICSDGTWQKGGQATPTNVWRTYLAVDDDNQIKLHDDGVGSGGSIRIHKIIGGAFGYGISRNIEQLLEALINIYEPGAKIYLFGFSRGAFTVRVLADLICLLGIPQAGDGTPEEISNKAKDLVAAYKQLNRERNSRISEDEHRANVDRLRGELNVHQIEGDFDVHFVGCWDTVEAVGLPTDVLKKLAIRFMFPLRFADQFPSPRVRHLCHALCLDDERHTFHPLIWHTPNGGLSPGQTLDQVWFPGGHAHVGGGYAKDQLALTPLGWMLKKAKAAGLRLNEDICATYRTQSYRHGEMHSSRPGFYKFYRYCPRRLSDIFKGKNGEPLEKDLAACRVHRSVLDRITARTANYAPTAIDVDFTPVETEKSERSTPILSKRKLPEEFASGIKAVNEVQVSRGIWLYRLCLAACLALLGGGVLGANLQLLNPTSSKPVPLFGDPPFPLSLLFDAVYSAEYFSINLLKGLVPSFLSDSILAGLQNVPGVLSAFAIVFCLLLLLVMFVNAQLLVGSLKAWHQSGILDKDHQPPNSKSSSDVTRLAVKQRPRLQVSVAMIFAICGFLALATLGWKPYHAHARTDPSSRATTFLSTVGSTSEPVTFETADPLFASGVFVQAGAEYRVEVTDEKDWVDLNIPTGPDGFAPTAGQRRLAFLRVFGPRRNLGSAIELKKYLGQEKSDDQRNMFEMLASIGPDGVPIRIGKSANFNAVSSGQLYFYVNDFPGFYCNNKGTALITVERIR